MSTNKATTYPEFPDETITVGDRVRSFDFVGVTTNFIDGVVVDLVEFEDCRRYRIATPTGDRFPPVNGTPSLFGGVTRGVIKLGSVAE